MLVVSIKMSLNDSSAFNLGVLKQHSNITHLLSSQFDQHPPVGQLFQPCQLTPQAGSLACNGLLRSWYFLSSHLDNKIQDHGSSANYKFLTDGQTASISHVLFQLHSYYIETSF